MNWMREPDAEPLPGYRLIKPLGTGGFGEVWMCEAPGGILKAIKFVYGNLNAEDGGSIRAEQEFRALQKVKEVRHPFVLSIERIDVCDGELAIVMELADKSLHDCLVEYQESGKIGIPREHVLAFLSDAAEGLDYLSERHGLLHLDVKPRNLFLIGNHVKVADFGLVKNLDRQSSPGLMGGMSPMYAAPETFRGEMSKHSDQYSLGIVYMELITGLRPFAARNIRQLALQHMSEEPDLRPLTEADRATVARALSKDPAKRFPNCMAFIRSLLGSPRRPEITLDFSRPESLREPQPVGNMEKTPPTAPRLNSIGSTQVLTPEELKNPVSESVGQLHVTQAQQDVGVIRPTLLIGVGEYGLQSLREIRSRLLDRVGDLSHVPAFRFMYIDTDPQAQEKAVGGNPDQALRDENVFSIRLQPVANYRKRMLEHLTEWLPREKLFAIPRSLQPQGSRALGRLAFCDNYLRFDSRLNREIKLATHPESLAITMTQTGMNIRDNCPRVFIIASALGSSSGMLIDLAYTVRRRLAKMQFGNAAIVCFLYCGAPHDPTSTPLELANLYATLTEFHHFHDPAITFSSQYGGPDGPKLISEEWPFSNTYLMQQENRGPDAVRRSSVQLASYMLQDLISPLGAELDLRRSLATDLDTTPFRGFGTAGLWFPRGLMLRVAARQICQRLICEWQEHALPYTIPGIQELVERVRNLPDLQPEAIADRIEDRAPIHSLTPTEAVEKLLLEIESTVVGKGADLEPWAKRSLENVLAFVGKERAEEGTATYLQSRISRILNGVVQELANEWCAKLNAIAMRLMEQPGRRIASAEQAIKALMELFRELEVSVQKRSQAFRQRSELIWSQLRGAYEVCVQGGGFSLFGGRQQRNIRAFLTALRNFAQSRLTEELADTTARCYNAIASGLEERLADLNFCRQRLSQIHQIVVDPNPSSTTLSSQASLSQTAPVSQISSSIGGEQVVLPYGERDIEWAAARFIQTLKPDHWIRLDEVLQSLVLAPLGGLFAICQEAGDLLRKLGSPLIDQTTAYLENLIGSGDFSRGEFFQISTNKDMLKQVKRCYEHARPSIGRYSNNETLYVVLPGGEEGMELAEAIREELTNAVVIRSLEQTNDFLVCREVSHLDYREIQELLGHCREAYQQLASKPGNSPHSRFDVLEWMPLDV